MGFYTPEGDFRGDFYNKNLAIMGICRYNKLNRFLLF